MLFHSAGFLFLFLPIVLLVFKYVKASFPRSILLVFFSYFFYAGADPVYVVVLVGSSLVDFYAAVFLARTSIHWKRKALLFCSLSVNLGVLISFKYWELFSAMFFALLGVDLLPSVLQMSGISTLPPGLSFYTFQSMSYTIDVYREETKPERTLLDFCNYVAYFPQLIAGPIERHNVLGPQLNNWMRGMCTPHFSAGLDRIALGIIGKLFFSDSAGRIVDNLLSSHEPLTTLDSWIVALGFGLQIFFDFSAYTSIAIGLALLMGVHLTENFLSPYKATSPRDFWKRWHLTLSTWFRDYVFIPLGGSRGSMPRRALVVIITFTLSGLWHGAGGNFILWGMFHGLLYTATSLIPWGITLPLWTRRLGTFVAIQFSWILFRIDNSDKIFSLWSGMCGVHEGALRASSLGDIAFILCTSIGLQLLPNASERWPGRSGWRESLLLWIGALFLLCISPQVETFIYFRF
jgi:alginate O-acetyltransferase complex protein AlgI